MCIEPVGEWERAEEDLMVWKVVTKEGYSPQWPASNREIQYGYEDVGSRLYYPEGGTVRSDRPGVYLMRSFEWARRWAESPEVVRECVIPKGTEVLVGQWGQVCALKVIVGREVE